MLQNRTLIHLSRFTASMSFCRCGNSMNTVQCDVCWLVIESWAFSSRPAICGSWHVPRRSYHVTSHCTEPYNWSYPRAGWRCHYAPLFLFFIASTSAFCKSQLG